MIKWLLQISKTNRRGLFGVRRSNAMQQPSYFSLSRFSCRELLCTKQILRKCSFWAHSYERVPKVYTLEQFPSTI